MFKTNSKGTRITNIIKAMMNTGKGFIKGNTSESMNIRSIEPANHVKTW